MSTNPFDDEDTVLQALTELLESSLERTERRLNGSFEDGLPESSWSSKPFDLYLPEKTIDSDFHVAFFDENSQCSSPNGTKFGHSAKGTSKVRSNDSVRKSWFLDVDQEVDHEQGSFSSKLDLDFGRAGSSKSERRSDSPQSRYDTHTSPTKIWALLQDDPGGIAFSMIGSPEGFQAKKEACMPAPSGPSLDEIDQALKKATFANLEVLYQCPICLELPRGAVLETSCCQQVFCEECINTALSSIPDRTCPLCRGEPLLKPNYVVENLLATLEVKCHTCEFVAPISILKNHANECKVRKRFIGIDRGKQTQTMAASPGVVYQSTADHSETTSWTCSRCTLINEETARSCDACNYPSPIPVRDADLGIDEEGHSASAQAFSPMTSNTSPTLSSTTSAKLERKVTSSNSSDMLILKCPFCHTQLHVPSLNSPNEPFKCGSCWNMITVPNSALSAVGFGTSHQVPETTKTMQGEILLRVSTAGLLRNEKWRVVLWRVDDHGLLFTDQKHRLLRRVHIHPFLAFTQVKQKVSASRPTSTVYVTKLVENPRSAVAVSLNSVRKGAFSMDLPVKEICEIATKGEATNVISFVEAVERAIKAKRNRMTSGLRS